MKGEEKSESASGKNTTINWKIMIIRFLFVIILIGSLLFLSAGRWDWREGWAYFIFTAGTLVISRAVLIIKFPEMARERMNAGKKEDVKAWDKYLVPIIVWVMPMAALVIAGLDERFGWSPPQPEGLQIAAFVVSCAGSLFSTWALFANRFFSSHARIQTDRGQTVTRSGPYQVVRHPGYAGGVISWIGTVVFFGSRWMAIPVILTILTLIVRTYLEDKMLQEELPGYQAYAQEVRYRLLPGIW